MITQQIIPVLAAIIFNSRNQVLIARRKLHLSNGGKWEFPGGKLRPNEAPELCLQREIQEELGIKIRVNQPFHAVNCRYQKKTILLLAYKCEFLSGDWELVDHDQISWVKPQEIVDYDLSAADIPIAKKLKNKF